MSIKESNKIDLEYNLEFEEKITCGKIKSKAKTLLVAQINKMCFCDSNNFFMHKTSMDEQNQLNMRTIKFKTIVVSYSNPINYNLICSHLSNSTIIISTQPNPKINDNHVFFTPGYLCEIKNKSLSQIELNMNFDNFFPHNIPFDNTHYTHPNKIYVMIWFKNILSSNLINNATISYELANTKICKSNMIMDNCVPVQQTQTFNINCKNEKIMRTKKIPFNNMCRAFWIKINQSDYNNLKEIELQLNGHTRFLLNKKQIELVFEVKKILNNYVLIYINLELDSDNIDYSLPQNLYQVSQIYSNSLNSSRIDSIIWKFVFDEYAHDNMQISSLNLNELSLVNNKLYRKIY